MTEEVRVGTLLKLITEMEHGGREIGDIYVVTKTNEISIHYRLLKGAVPRYGWDKGSLNRLRLRQYWEVLPSVPNAQYM